MFARSFNVGRYPDCLSLRAIWFPYTGGQPKARTHQVIYERTYFTRSACTRLFLRSYVVMHVRGTNISRKEKRLGRCSRFYSRRRTMCEHICQIFDKRNRVAFTSHDEFRGCIVITKLKKNCFFSRHQFNFCRLLNLARSEAPCTCEKNGI